MRSIRFMVVLFLTLGIRAIAEPTTVGFLSGSRIWLEGSSTLHPYHADASQFTARLQGPMPDLSRPTAGSALGNGELDIPIAHLQSGDGMLDAKLRATLRPDLQPAIHFRLQRFSVLAGTTPGTSTLHLDGLLSLAGVERPTGFDLKVVSNTGTVRLTGSEVLKMSEFGILPPVFMIFMKTADEVTVRFDLRVRNPHLPKDGVGGSGE